MRTKVIYIFHCVVLIGLWGASGFAKDEVVYVPETGLDICPLPEFTPTKSTIDEDEPGQRPVDPDQDLKDLGTDFVNEHFFSTNDTLFNFMRLVYGRIEAVLNRFVLENDFDDKAITLLFKGGNVLRMVANESLDLLDPKERNFLQKEYGQYFKRSDADFSVYVDELRLKELDYDSTFATINELVFKELGELRKEFHENPGDYFNFLRLKPKVAAKTLRTALDNLNQIKSISDEKSEWFQTKFTQFQLLDDKALPEPSCPFVGQHDFQSLPEDGKISRIRLSLNPDWITNSDNQAIESYLSSDPNQKVKFFLVRSKVAFEAFFMKDGVLKRKPVVGELIDVSLPHRKDDHLRSFLDNYDDNITTYTLKSSDGQEVKIKSYTLSYLAQDLQFILFDSAERPWEDKKYEKRIYRQFFLNIAEILGAYGLGAKEIDQYVTEIRGNIIEPLKKLYPMNGQAAGIIEDVKSRAHDIATEFSKLKSASKFWTELAKFVDVLDDKPKKDDQEQFESFLKIIEKNLDNTEKMGHHKPVDIDIEEIRNVEIENVL